MRNIFCSLSENPRRIFYAIWKSLTNIKCSSKFYIILDGAVISGYE